MKAAMGRETYLSLALAAIAVLLVGVLAWEWGQGMQLKRELLKLQTIPAVPAKPLNVLPEFVLPAEETGFPELVSRSLFSLSRRSSAAAVKGGVAAMKKGQFVLVGVLITPQRSSAQLRDVQTSKAETVALNGVVRGMTLGEVGPSRVVLRQGTESEELILNVQTGPKGAAAARAPAPPPAAAAPVAAAASAPVPGASAPSPSPAATPSAPARGASSPSSAPASGPGALQKPPQPPIPTPQANASKQQ